MPKPYEMMAAAPPTNLSSTPPQTVTWKSTGLLTPGGETGHHLVVPCQYQGQGRDGVGLEPEVGVEKDYNKTSMTSLHRNEQGSLDGSNPDGTKKLHLSEFGGDFSLDSSLDRKTFKDSSIMSSSASKLAKRESLKEKKKNYRSQKKEVAREIMNSASDQSFVLMADWLKVRGTLKGWTKLWCLCKPGMLILYKSEKMKTGHWVGTILLNTCQLLQRPSKKEGFCFKLFHPMDQSIWATKGPKGETIGAFVQPLPVSYLIFRAPSENQGKCWMDGLELALRCTSLIKRTTSRPQDMSTALIPDLSDLSSPLNELSNPLTAADLSTSAVYDTEDGLEELEETVEEHFSDDDDHSSIEMSGSDFELAEEDNKPVTIPRVEETPYITDQGEELGQQGDACQTEEVNEENKSLIWTLVKQVRPGMDLSKVVLPTFILEPRSFLDKLTDYYYHADLLSQAVQQETALERMKHVVKWYLSGFYKKPKGLKKPYNPIIGETFRCYWTHPETKSRTFYVAEQISHHPPVSAFHVTNRHDGFNINGCILAKSKFYGNSISAILEGAATLTFLERGEDYFITMPYAHCKGILLGTLTMEMGGKVTLNCPKTGYHCDLDFKLKPFFGNGESANRITGRIRMGSEVLCTFEGHWDQQIYIKELTNRERVVFWDPSPEVRSKRLVRHVVPLDKQLDNESQRMWKRVSDAVISSDMHTATAEKHFLEEKQRSEAKERHKAKLEWTPKWFTLDTTANKWIYKLVDGRPWDPMTDCVQYEKDYVIGTQTVHTIPKVWKGATGIGPTQVKGYNSSQLDSDSSDANITEVTEDRVRCVNTNRAPTSTSDGLTQDSTKDKYQHKKFGNNASSDSGANQIQRKGTPEHMTMKSYSINLQSGVKTSALPKGAESPQNRQRISSEVGWDSPTVKRTVNCNTPVRSPSKEYCSTSNGPHQLGSGPGSPNKGVRRDLPTGFHNVIGKSGSTGALSRELEAIVRMEDTQQKLQSSVNQLLQCVGSLETFQKDLSARQTQQQQQMQQLQGSNSTDTSSMFSKEWLAIVVVLIAQMIFQFYLSR